jgi:hypothetical protein
MPGSVESVAGDSAGWTCPMAEFGFGEIELDRLMLGDVTSLCRPHPFKSPTIAIKNCEPVADFGDPEIQVGNMSGKLMTIQRNELLELA